MFTVSYGYGPRDIDAVLAEVRNKPRQSTRDIINSAASAQADDSIKVHSSLAAEMFPGAEDPSLARTLPALPPRPARGANTQLLGRTRAGSALTGARHGSAPHSGGLRITEDVRERHEQTREEAARKLVEIQAQVLARKEVAARRVEADFAATLGRLNDERVFVDQISDYLAVREGAVHRRQAALHDDWRRKVFDEIQRQVQRGLDAQSTAAIQRRRCDLQRQYVEITGKRHVLVDVVNQDEYDPFKYRDLSIKIDTSRLDDPTLRELRAIEQERQLRAHLGQPAGPQPQARAMLPVHAWGHSRDTLHGRYSLQEVTPEALAAQDRELGAGAGPRPRASLIAAAGPEALAGTRSSIVWDHFTPPAELARQDKTLLRGLRKSERTLRGEPTSRVIAHDLPPAPLQTNAGTPTAAAAGGGSRGMYRPPRAASASPYATDASLGFGGAARPATSGGGVP